MKERRPQSEEDSVKGIFETEAVIALTAFALFAWIGMILTAPFRRR